MNNTEAAISKIDALTLLETIYQCGLCKTVQDASAIMQKTNTLLDFDNAVYVLARFNKNGAIDNYSTINFSYPAEWLKIYKNRKFHTKDPIALENFSNFGLQYWVDTKKKYNADADFLAIAEDFNLVNGYSYGTINQSRTEGCLLSLSGKLLKHPREIYILTNLSPHLHVAFSNIIRTQNPNKSILQISIREKEVLNWVSQGKSTWDISIILNISERTVKFHIDNIMKKLDAVSRSHAVAIASSLGIINFA